MLNFLGSRYRCCDGSTRRDFLQVGALGLGGLTLADLLSLQAQGAARPKSAVKSIIMVYLHGGPSHIDMFDMKPDAPAEVRGEFKPISTSLPGLNICELLPELAKVADKMTVIRNMCFSEFADAHDPVLVYTGFHFRPMVRPTFGSVVSKLRGGIGPHDNTSTGWLERVRSGEPSAWQAFVRLYGPLIYHWCQRCGLQAADAADVGQDVFRAVLVALPQFQREADGSFRGWLRVITRNKVRDFLREQTRVPGTGGETGDQLASVAADPVPGEGIDPDEERILYRRALELVLAEHREETRQAFLRVVIDRQDPAAVASDLGLTVNAIYLAKSRILRRLREEFEGLLEPQPEQPLCSRDHMNRLPHEPPAGSCPERLTLIAYQAGRLSGLDEDRLAGHVETCATCISTIRELSNTPLDPFEAKLLKFCSDRSDLLDTSHPAYIRLQAGALELLDHDTCSIGADGAASTDLEVSGVGKIGPYTILDVLGRGGMGVVYRAFHQGLKRPVALKTLHPAAYVRPESLARFRVEGEAVARLDHPNIVRVYDSGESDRQLYLAMELVEGETLSMRLGRSTMGHLEIIRLMRSLAAAVGYAHEKKVIHRDLKPSNVLITRGGIPKVVDFGLARVLDGPQLTASDAVMGTPFYMAPEQAAGRVAEINEQTDIYALGVILYQALTGVPPFMLESKLRIKQIVRKGDVALPPASNPEIPLALETICFRCLEPLQKDRYRGAHELVQELDRLLEGKPIQTRRPSRWRWVGRAARRRAPAALAILLLAAGLVGATAALLPQQAVSAVPNGESESVRRELEGELDKGRPVTLVGEKGYPKWFRWRAGGASQRMNIEPDGTFLAEIPAQHVIGMMELLPDTRTDRYKLTAQVRHDLGGYGGHVGLYFAHHTYPRQPQEIQVFNYVRFNAVTASPVSRIHTANGATLIPEDATFWLSLATGLHVERDEPENIDIDLSLLYGGRMTALGQRNGVWHDLTITVTPDGIEVNVAGHPMTLTGKDLSGESLNAKCDHLRKVNPDDATIQNVRPEFVPRGAVGLYLRPKSAASTRNVTVTPLPAVK